MLMSSYWTQEALRAAVGLKQLILQRGCKTMVRERERQRDRERETETETETDRDRDICRT